MIPPVKKGQRIELIWMDDPHHVAPGTKGTVTGATYLSFAKQWQIYIDWDNGRSLSLVHPDDRYRIIED